MQANMIASQGADLTMGASLLSAAREY
jgi:hypothetical protein